MKQCARIFWLFFLMALPPSIVATGEASPLVSEKTFVAIIRDMELLHSWFIDQGHTQAQVATLRIQYYQKILASYQIGPQVFQESVQYYLVDTLERAVHVYEQVYMALEALLPTP